MQDPKVPGGSSFSPMGQLWALAPTKGGLEEEQQHTFRICPKHTSSVLPFNSQWKADICEFILTLLDSVFLFTPHQVLIWHKHPTYGH